MARQAPLEATEISIAESDLTPEQYLEIERAAERKSEYYAGQMFLMAGASEADILIGTNLLRELSARLSDCPYRLYGNDLRVKNAVATSSGAMRAVRRVIASEAWRSRPTPGSLCSQSSGLPWGRRDRPSANKLGYSHAACRLLSYSSLVTCNCREG